MIRFFLFTFLICFCSCHTTKKANSFADSSRSQETSWHNTNSFVYAQLDSFLRTWTVSAEGLEAEVSIPLTTNPTRGEMSFDSSLTDTTPHVPSLNTQPPSIGIRIRAKSLNANGEHKGRVLTEVADSSNTILNTASKEHDLLKEKRKTVQHPAIIWWTGVGVFIFVILYFIWRWLKRS